MSGIKGKSGKYIKTQQHRENLSKSHKGIKLSELHKQRLSESHIGKKRKPHTEETKEKIRQSNIGQKRSQETKNKLKISRARQIMKPLSIERRKKLSEDRKGDKWYTWKGGITKVNLGIRNSFEYKLWRESVFKRDNYTCIWCGLKSGNGKAVILNADHIKPFAHYPELRFAIDNGRTLCKSCHEKTDTFGGKCKNDKRTI